MAQEVGQVDVGKLIDRYIKENLPQADEPFHWQAEIKAGFNSFKEWYKSTQSIPEIGQSDIKKEKLNDLIDVEKRDTLLLTEILPVIMTFIFPLSQKKVRNID